MRLPLSLDDTISGHMEMPVSAAVSSINYGCSGADALRSTYREALASNDFCSGRRPESE